MKTIEELRDALDNALRTTFENMLFEEIYPREAIPEEELAGITDDDTNQIWALIPFIKPEEGIIFLQISRESAQALAINMHSDLDEADGSFVVVLDVIAEMMNTIAGNFLNLYLEADQLFKLGLPNTGEGECPCLADSKLVREYIAGTNIVKLGVTGEMFEGTIK